MIPYTILMDTALFLRREVYDQVHKLPTLPTAQAERWDAPGILSNITLGEIPLHNLIHTAYKFSEVDPDNLLSWVRLHMEEKSPNPERTVKRLQKMIPGVAWLTIGHPAERKLRLLQVMATLFYVGAEIKAYSGIVSLTYKGVTIRVQGAAAAYGRKTELRQRPFLDATSITWQYAINHPPGASRWGHRFLTSFYLSMAEILPQYEPQIKYLCRVLAYTKDRQYIRALMDVFNAPRTLCADGGDVSDELTAWERLAQVIQTSTSNPVRTIAKELKDTLSKEEVYKAFGVDEVTAFAQITPAMKDHYLWVLGELKEGRHPIQTGVDPAEVGLNQGSEESEELKEMFDLYRLMR